MKQQELEFEISEGFGFELEHVKVDLESFKEKDKPGFFLQDFVENYQVITYRFCGGLTEYSTVVYQIKPRESCMQPVEARSKMIAQKSSKTIEEAVQFHYDALNYLKED